MVSKSLMLSLGGLGIAGVGGVGIGLVGVYYLNKGTETPKVTLSTKYDKALINFNSDDVIWNSKLSTLETQSSIPKNENLIKAKNEKKAGNVDAAKAFLKSGCRDIYSKSPESKDDFNDFKNFCSKLYLDQISGGKVITEIADLDNKWDTFKGKTDDHLSGEFRKIHESKKSSTTEPTDWKQLVLAECQKLSSSIFVGEVKGYQEFCFKKQ
ncbi:hypothetical protein MHC_04055 [Mycoplasma haemocanis str. Illinois]|uniref:Uncharacterized protein n=1 Tax=Mycoplasma haemocanis (strain Illinois) TaxID=1111676 RepID=H6N7P5_MYCHN|nr:hypothetical protein [Mycoplasma haemocanis]AEW45667.1 hypothetical protein MHC_04055 [Mycoplasma haemocanis str. Illinois]